MAVRNLPLSPRQFLPRLIERPVGLVRRVAGRARAAGRVARARVGYGAGVATACWGVGVLFGLGWALLVGGVVMAGSFLLLYPVEDG